MAEEIYRYWVELRNLGDGATRNLPLQAFKRIHIPTRKGEPPLPDEEVLRLEDGSAAIEAKTLESLADQLRQKYPDQSFERVLKYDRDTVAEERHAAAMNGLIKILAKAAVDRLMSEEAASEIRGLSKL